MFMGHMNITDLVMSTCNGKLEERAVTLKATIIGINENSGWYYVACKPCLRKVVPTERVYVCNSCAKTIAHPLILFLVNVTVQDKTGSTTLVLFNGPIERELDISAKKIFNKMSPGDDTYPPELMPLMGRELVFKLKINNYNIREGLDPNLHFVESPALAPPEVHIDLAAQQQHEAELIAAASQPLPDDDDKENPCHIVKAPANVSWKLMKLATHVARRAVSSLEGAGVFAVELFLTADGQVSDSLPSRTATDGRDAYAINKRCKLMNVAYADEEGRGEGANKANKENK